MGDDETEEYQPVSPDQALWIKHRQISRLKKNMYVSTHTIEVLCTILNCPVEDVMEVVPDEGAAGGLERAEGLGTAN